MIIRINVLFKGTLSRGVNGFSLAGPFQMLKNENHGRPFNLKFLFVTCAKVDSSKEIIMNFSQL